MKAIVDTNILLRYSNPVDPAHTVIAGAINQLQSDGTILHILPQNHYEYWVVATRPVERNGFGMTVVECDSLLAQVERAFPLLADQESLLSEWRRHVVTHDCKGKIAHDARLVAAMKTHGIIHIVTFNGKDFARFPDVVVLDPHALTGTNPSS